MLPFYSPRKHQKTKMFSEAIKWEHWLGMVKKDSGYLTSFCSVGLEYLNQFCVVGQ